MMGRIMGGGAVGLVMVKVVGVVCLTTLLIVPHCCLLVE